MFKNFYKDFWVFNNMKKVVVACSGAKHIGRKIASKLKADYSELSVVRFPDGEFDIRFLREVKGKEVLLVQSFYNDLNSKIVETLFAAHTAKELGAKRVNLLALYFPYLRKDKRFKSGECVSAEVMAELFKVFNKLFIVEPHLHRIKKLKKLFSNGKRVRVVLIIAEYIKKLGIKDIVFVGPDVESMQWVKGVADLLGGEVIVLKKVRYGARKVKIKNLGKIDLKGKNVVIVDDIISSGHTILETIKKLKEKTGKPVSQIIEEKF